MDLYSGIPCWILQDQAMDYFHPLPADHKIDVVIIGSGITGAFIAHELASHNIEHCVIDRGSISMGSSIASTSLLQYEIDVPLSKMARDIGEAEAVLAYRSCLQSIGDIEGVLAQTQVEADFERVPSLYYASNKRHVKLLEDEFAARQKHNLPVEFLGSAELLDLFGIQAPCALLNKVSAQMDAYSGASRLLLHHHKKNNVDIFSHTEIVHWKEKPGGYELKTKDGKTIRCKYVIIAAGFEAGAFLPKQVMQLTSTYAIMSQPLSPEHIWRERSLIWETKEPYLYIRTAHKNRVIVGGEDEEFSDPERRDSLLRKKARTLERKFKKLFPHIPFVPEVAWCGTFSSTEDGLPFIGAWPGRDRMLFALGYGGNGITFSMIAAQIIRHILQGQKDERQDVFSFSQKRLQRSA